MAPETRRRAPVVGIVGGGQLAQMTYQAAISLGLVPRILAARTDDSAALVARQVEFGEPTSIELLAAFAASCDVVTFDHELVDIGQLQSLATFGRCFRPSLATVAIVQDKLLQRQKLAALDLPTPRFREATSASNVLAFGHEQGWPVVAKTRRGGYDGRGVWVLAGPKDAELVTVPLIDAGAELLVETWVPIEREVAILVARRPSGQMAAYPLVETIQVEGICRELIAPADVAPEVALAARRIALTIAEALDVAGILAVEFFVTNGWLVVNELAARPHNSGHYSIEGCVTSQFENHLRAILDWPLGVTDLVAPAVVTVNLLGAAEAPDPLQNLPRALDVAGARVHLYAKEPRPGRKLGHVTVLGDDLPEALSQARAAARFLVQPSLAGGNS